MMYFFLLFCSHVESGVVCAAPQPMPSNGVCEFVGRNMVSLAEEAGSFTKKYRCVSVNLVKPKK